MHMAAKNGDINIVNLMIENGAEDFDRGLLYAADGGHNDIVMLMINKGYNSLSILK